MVSEDTRWLHGVPCSLTVHFLEKARHDVEDARTFQLYEDLIPGYEDLLTQAHVDSPTPAARRLRGFYCLEVLYHLHLPRVMMVNPIMMEEGFSMVFRRGVPRTREGLNTLLEAVESLNKFVVVGATELDMVGVKENVTRPDASSLRRGSMGQIALIASYVERIATRVRASLIKEEVDLGAVGLIFAEALVAVKETPTQCLHYGRTLLNISEETGISPWDKKQQA